MSPTLQKLDIILILMTGRRYMFPLITVTKLVKDIFDHNLQPLGTINNTGSLSKNREFRFDFNWLNNEEFILAVSEIRIKNVHPHDHMDIINVKMKDWLMIVIRERG